jgi:hypothetical protein
MHQLSASKLAPSTHRQQLNMRQTRRDTNMVLNKLGAAM